MTQIRPAGELLREWRQRRRLTQIELAARAEISTRHLSFVETGRAQPSRGMLLCLAEKLEIPLRERNTLLLSAGYAPIFPQRSLTDPELQLVQNAIDVVLTGHEPYPAIAVDRHWTLVGSNSAVAPLLAGIDPALLAPPVNVLRFTLHPRGLAPRMANYSQWRLHMFDKLRRHIDVSHDPFLIELLRELREYPQPQGVGAVSSSTERNGPTFVLPFQLASDEGILSFFSTTTTFGTPLDVSLSEISLECFYPADRTTIEALRRISAAGAERAAAVLPET
jgi:transcriptional regulator with XRE-family HTH domain